MSSSHYTIRDDDAYTVVVGWEEELDTFYACVFPGTSRTGEPLLAAGEEPGEIATLRQLVRVVMPYARLDAATAAALRGDAAAAGLPQRAAAGGGGF